MHSVSTLHKLGGALCQLFKHSLHNIIVSEFNYGVVGLFVVRIQQIGAHFELVWKILLYFWTTV